MSKNLVFIPVYNCQNQIRRVLQQFTPDVSQNVDTILVINNRSTDNTEQAAIEAASGLDGMNIKILRNNENYGLGGSQKIGLDYAIENRYDFATILHGDDQGSIRDLQEYLSGCWEPSHDAVLGARFMSGSSISGYSRFRILGNHVFNGLFSAVCHKRLYDLGSGLNMYRVETLRDRYFMMFPDDLTFNYAMILAHCQRGDDVVFFPITWREEDQVSNVKIVNQSFRVLEMLGRYFYRGGRYLFGEHRKTPKKAYTYEVIYELDAY